MIADLKVLLKCLCGLLQNVHVLKESAAKQASQISWMKSHLHDSQQDDNGVIGVIQRWEFIRKKVDVILKKIVKITGQKDINRSIVELRVWLEEAESFMQYHCKESRKTQDILKIKVAAFFIVFIFDMFLYLIYLL